MPLPILSSTTADLVRLLHRSQLDWCRAVGEETTLDCGTLICNPDLPTIAEANCIVNARIIPGTTAAKVVESVGADCRRWSLNPSVTAEQTSPLADHLVQTGWLPITSDIFLLRKQRPLPTAPTGLTIIPARAGFAQYRQLLEQSNTNGQAIEAAMLHLDDSHFDALLAIIDRQPVASIGVLASGDVGTIHQWFVAENFRRRGIGRLMLDRALEICIRASFRHVMAVAPAVSAAAILLQSTGFEKVGEWVVYEHS